jgi:hypothetical protein
MTGRFVLSNKKTEGGQMKGFLMALLAILCIISAAPAEATPWHQAFKETEAIKFNEIAMFMTSGDESFSGMSRYGNLNWSAADATDFIIPSGNFVKNLRFNLGFTGKDPFSFDIFVIRDNGPVSRIIDAMTYSWTGTTWDVDDIRLSHAASIYQRDMNATAAAPVPEPTTILLFASGLLGLAFVGRKPSKMATQLPV